MLYFLSFLFFFFQTEGKISVENQWIRNAGKGMNTAFFADVKNISSKTDTLFKVASSLAKLVQIHETYEENGMMGMREVGNLEIKSGQTLQLKPRSYHVMLIGLKKDLKEDQIGEVTLFFKHAGAVKVKAKVKNMIK
ncbi:MAG: copper chaperone PCu(A)C [Ignavibacteriaceae bacterium]|nr:copper chaperone PCu(A)C [Ignavibacteriaceae bacterium]